MGNMLLLEWVVIKGEIGARQIVNELQCFENLKPAYFNACNGSRHKYMYSINIRMSLYYWTFSP